MPRRLFLLVPSFQPTGPVRGAIALANALAKERDVTLVALKGGPIITSLLQPEVRQVSLEHKRWPGRVDAYRRLLQDAGGRDRVASISCLLSADLVNLRCRRHAVTCASVRGNLPVNYRMDYGPIGIPIAMAHLRSLRQFDHVVAMTKAMARQVQAHTGRLPHVIGNFIDEAPLEPYRRAGPGGAWRFVFVGSLTQRKRPTLVVDAVHALRSSNRHVHLDVVGDGPLREQVRQVISRLELERSVVLHGHVDNPHEIVANADVLVLPSLSEGIPRAALEALHLGVPCVLRAVDGHAELIEERRQGALFDRDEDLASAMEATAEAARRCGRATTTLLPPRYRQASAAREYLTVVER